MTETPKVYGFKSSDFVSEGEAPKDLPAGVRLYLKERNIDLNQAQSVARVYRLESDGGLKNKKVLVGKIMNHRPEDDEIGEMFGGGSFIWIMKYLAPDGTEVGLMSEPVEIDLERGAQMHAAYIERQKGTKRQSQPETAPASVPAAAPVSPMSDFSFMLQFQQASEERTLAMIERLSRIFGQSKNDAPADVLRAAYEGANKMMLDTVALTRKAATALNERTVAQIEEDGEEAAALPEKVQGPVSEGPLGGLFDAFMPQIEAAISRLLAGGPVGNITKKLILSSEEWKQIFNDPESWKIVVGELKERFGEKKANEALDILLNKRPEAKATQNKKGRA